MILDPSIVVARLADPAEFVRAFVSGYIMDMGRNAPIDADGVFAAIDALRPGDPESANLLYINLVAVRPTPAAVARMVDELSTVTRDRPASCLIDPLTSALRRVEPDLLAPVIERIETNAKLPWKLRRALRQRIDLCDRSVDELWDRLMTEADTLERRWAHGTATEVDDAELQAENWIAAATTSPAAPELIARAVELLSQPPVGHAREVAAMRMLVRRPPGAEAIPGLCARLDFDVEEYACEAAVAALAAIGGDDVIRAVEDELQDEQIDPLSRQTVLAMIKRPASLAALQRREETDDPATRDSNEAELLEKILQLAPTDEALLQRVGAAVNRGFARRRFSWMEAALAYLGVNGLLGRTDDPVARSLELLLSPVETDDPEARGGYRELRRELLQSDPAATGSVPVEVADALGYVVSPIRRTTERIGRNDPCPCGSGKKYKKCCGM
jgi:hypothetical protein